MSWSKVKVINELKAAHTQWANDESKCSFNYTFLRKNYGALISRIETRKDFTETKDAFVAAGIDPYCHQSKFDYGKTDKEIKSTFVEIVKTLKAEIGVEYLNDNHMNSGRTMKVPKRFRFAGVFKECKKHKCQEFEITYRSIYARGRGIFNTWPLALKAAGIDYEKEVLRKPTKISREDYIKNFQKYIKEKGNQWNVKSFSEENHPTYKGIYNSHEESIFSNLIDDKVLCAYVELSFKKQRKIKEVNEFYKQKFNEIQDDFFDLRLFNSIWGKTQRVRGQLTQWRGKSYKKGDIPKKVKYELLKRYAKGQRITRGELNKSTDGSDKKLLSVTRRRDSPGEDHNETLKQVGFLSEGLYRLYAKLDEPYPTERIYKEFQRLVGESLENERNQLTREYAARYEKDLHDAVIRQYKSWDKGLKEFGLDSKVFALTANHRTKRGYIFECFFEDLLIRYGFVSVAPKLIIEPNEFVCRKTFKGCRHKVKCKPDFLFNDYIIDTKTGFTAKRQKDQFRRYLSHRDKLIIITLNGKYEVKTIGKGKLISMSFSDFIKRSKKILGVKISDKENKNLTKALKHPDVDPFVGLKDFYK